ncbi:hypothetical protein GDO81_013561 [Engystomops pustulosus]|uniref:Bactericidal permeability-increasing protein n=1 Tax=Engystomops pustulosus TaxID=76066 RepID=A0AAV7B4U2_ENGPU|nr:hypothetical protein GDO81_013561 [Engystomops pustulosus]
MELSLILLTVSLILCETKTTEPGIKGRLTLRGLQYGWQVGLEEIHKQLKTIEIPEVRGSVSVTILGRIDYYVSKLQIKNLDLSSSDISFSSDTGVNVFINKGQIQVSGLLNINSVLFSASSWLELSVQELTLNGTVGITCDDFGHGAVWNAGCSSNAGNVNLRFHGGAGWLFSMFKGAVMGPIHDALHSQICPAFSKAVENMEKVLINLPVTLSVDEAALFDISLLGPPLITEKTFDLLVKGEFDGRFHHWDLPLSPEEIILPDIDSRMLLMAVSEYTANSAGFVHYKTGALKINITDDMVSGDTFKEINILSFPKDQTAL